MGQVYLAEHVKMGRKSAIKVMNPAMVHDADAVGRFNREAANASRINHPNVAAIYDFGETSDGLIYLAMEFVEGEPLTELVRGSTARCPRRARRRSRGRRRARSRPRTSMGIVHRDLKPDNIMISRGARRRRLREGRGLRHREGGRAARAQKVTQHGARGRHAGVHESRSSSRATRSTAAATSTRSRS